MKALLFCLGLLFMSSVLHAQTTVDVIQMKISKPSSSAPTRFDLMTVNQSGEPVNFTVFDSGAIPGIPQYTLCTPCKAPQLFETNVFDNPISVQINQTSTFIKVHYTSIQMSQVYLSSRMFSRKTDFGFNRPIRLQGRLEIIDLGAPGGRVLYVDNDVVLEGSYSILFWKPYVTFSGRTLTDFKGIVYDFVKPL